MTNDKKRQIIPKSTMKRIMLAFLRTIPLLPAPEIYEIIEDLKRSRTSIDEKIQNAYKSMQETNELIGELEENLKERTEKLTLLHQEYERYSRLAEIEEENSRALIQQLEFSLGKGRKREYWMSLIINLIAGFFLFFIGIILSPLIQNWLGIGG